MCVFLWDRGKEAWQTREGAQGLGNLPGKLSGIFSEAKLIFQLHQGVLPGIVVNNLTLAILSCPCFILSQSDSLLVGAVRIRSKLQQVQNFSGIYWPVVSREML